MIVFTWLELSVLSSSSARIALYAAAFLLAVLAVVLAPQGKTVLVVAYPGQPASALMRTIADADGQFVAAARVPWMALATSDTPDFPTRLRQAGAFAVLNQMLAMGCKRGTSL